MPASDSDCIFRRCFLLCLIVSWVQTRRAVGGRTPRTLDEPQTLSLFLREETATRQWKRAISVYTELQSMETPCRIAPPPSTQKTPSVAAICSLPASAPIPPPPFPHALVPAPRHTERLVTMLGPIVFISGVACQQNHSNLAERGKGFTLCRLVEHFGMTTSLLHPLCQTLCLCLCLSVYLSVCLSVSLWLYAHNM